MAERQLPDTWRRLGLQRQNVSPLEASSAGFNSIEHFGTGNPFWIECSSDPASSTVSVMMVLDHSVVRAVILIVEDEMLLRMRAVDMVEDAGYTSVEAVDADEAVAILESRSDIALMFTDIRMPGSMDGLKLAHAVHERWPPIKIILVSGQLRRSNIDIPPDSRLFWQSHWRPTK